ncbi:MAG: hypothetical protein GWO20_05875 [Candidatus Korarchaeota archaeon]|nr:hypothetical protein [Candidatus Korarchaeota archaeon]NIU84785.1 hypothetical protein [Candidatus Thorarchaeota archaeon]NIW14779.1 hypothetical protein [Candidatus Thorarchaeota archaeon]NIW51509.1 hypothetical protein [Candidatus Korarchaeota archaeon]
MWEKDFEKSSVGGWDSIYVDDADFAYFAGHGAKGLIHFSTNYDGDGSYEKEVHYSETKWGDGDLEWIALSSCQTLHPDVTDEWIAHACAGNHLHAILGFKTCFLDKDAQYLGTTFANYLLNGKGIKDAWKTATKEKFGSDVTYTLVGFKDSVSCIKMKKIQGTLIACLLTIAILTSMPLAPARGIPSQDQKYIKAIDGKLLEKPIPVENFVR